MNTFPYGIVVIDDHPIIHDGLKLLLEGDERLRVIGASKSAAEAFDLLDNTSPDLAIVDLSLGDSDGTYIIQQLKHRYPKLRLLVYTMSEEKLFAERAADAGARGYVMKTKGPSELKEAIHSVLNGELSFSADILDRIQNKQEGKSVGQTSKLDNLSNREMEIFRLIGQGLDSSEIAQKLKISRNTVDTHRINIKNKLSAKTGKEVDRMAFQLINNNISI